MELILPTKKYYQSYVDAIKEYQDNNVKDYRFIDAAKYDIFEEMERFRLGNNLPGGCVKATRLWLVTENEFIGEVSIRHSLTDHLLRFAGNIGYGIRYSKWNNGFGTMILSMALQYARDEIGLDKVLITCSDNNIASARVIEKNGGILQDKITNVIGDNQRITRRYWIEIV